MTRQGRVEPEPRWQALGRGGLHVVKGKHDLVEASGERVVDRGARTIDIEVSPGKRGLGDALRERQHGGDGLASNLLPHRGDERAHRGFVVRESPRNIDLPERSALPVAEIGDRIATMPHRPNLALHRVEVDSNTELGAVRLEAASVDVDDQAAR